MSDESGIHVGKGGMTFYGKDAVHLYRAIALKAAIGAAVRGYRVSGRLTLTKCLKLAEQYTGKTYKRGDAAVAIVDLQIWIDTMRAALPVEVDK